MTASGKGLKALDVVLQSIGQPHVFQALASWTSAVEPEESQNAISDTLSPSGLQKIVGFLSSSASNSRWDEVFTVASALQAALELDIGLASTLVSGPLCGKFQSALLLALASFCEGIENGMDEVSELVNKSEVQPMQLTAAVTQLCLLLQGLLTKAGTSFADHLLSASNVATALLCAAAMAPHTHPGPRTKLANFSVLQARRAASEVLATLLEDASPDIRGRTEREMVSEACEPAASRLVQALVLSHPDPKLNEVLLELLWRGLRRVDLSDPDLSPALALLRRLAGKEPCQRLRSVTAEELLDWGLDLSMQLSKRGNEVVGLPDCDLVWGGFRLSQCVVSFSAHSLWVDGAIAGDGEANDTEVSFEVPWACVQRPAAAIAQGLPLSLNIEIEALIGIGSLQPELETAIGDGNAPLQVSSSATEEDIGSAMENLRSLFTGNEPAQNWTDSQSTEHTQPKTCIPTTSHNGSVASIQSEELETMPVNVEDMASPDIGLPTTEVPPLSRSISSAKEVAISIPEQNMGALESAKIAPDMTFAKELPHQSDSVPYEFGNGKAPLHSDSEIWDPNGGTLDTTHSSTQPYMPAKENPAVRSSSFGEAFDKAMFSSSSNSISQNTSKSEARVDQSETRGDNDATMFAKEEHARRNAELEASRAEMMRAAEAVFQTETWREDLPTKTSAKIEDGSLPVALIDAAEEEEARAQKALEEQIQQDEERRARAEEARLKEQLKREEEECRVKHAEEAYQKALMELRIEEEARAKALEKEETQRKAEEERLAKDGLAKEELQRDVEARRMKEGKEARQQAMEEEQEREEAMLAYEEQQQMRLVKVAEDESHLRVEEDRSTEEDACVKEQSHRSECAHVAVKADAVRQRTAEDQTVDEESLSERDEEALSVMELTHRSMLEDETKSEKESKTRGKQDPLNWAEEMLRNMQQSPLLRAERGAEKFNVIQEESAAEETLTGRQEDHLKEAEELLKRMTSREAEHTPYEGGERLVENNCVTEQVDREKEMEQVLQKTSEEQAAEKETLRMREMEKEELRSIELRIEGEARRAQEDEEMRLIKAAEEEAGRQAGEKQESEEEARVKEQLLREKEEEEKTRTVEQAEAASQKALEEQRAEEEEAMRARKEEEMRLRKEEEARAKAAEEEACREAQKERQSMEEDAARLKEAFAAMEFEAASQKAIAEEDLRRERDEELRLMDLRLAEEARASPAKEEGHRETEEERTPEGVARMKEQLQQVEEGTPAAEEAEPPRHQASNEQATEKETMRALDEELISMELSLEGEAMANVGEKEGVEEEKKAEEAAHIKEQLQPVAEEAESLRQQASNEKATEEETTRALDEELISMELSLEGEARANVVEIEVLPPVEEEREAEQDACLKEQLQREEGEEEAGVAAEVEEARQEAFEEKMQLMQLRIEEEARELAKEQVVEQEARQNAEEDAIVKDQPRQHPDIDENPEQDKMTTVEVEEKSREVVSEESKTDGTADEKEPLVAEVAEEEVQTKAPEEDASRDSQAVANVEGNQELPEGNRATMQLDLEVLPLRELKDACQELNLCTKGRKADLVARLMMYADSVMTPADLASLEADDPLQESQPASSIQAPQPADPVTEIAPSEERCESPQQDSPRPRTKACADLINAMEASETAAVARLRDSVDEEFDAEEQHIEPPSDKEAVDLGATPKASKSLVSESASRKAATVSTPLDAKEAGELVRDLSRLSVAELRAACSEHGLPTKGGKTTLIERVAELLASQPGEEDDMPLPTQSLGAPPQPASPPGLWVPQRRSPLGSPRASETDLPPGVEAPALASTPRNNASEDSVPAAQSDPDGEDRSLQIRRDLEQLPIADLRAACKEHGVSAAGSKAVLAERLAALADEEPSELVRSEVADDATDSLKGLSLDVLQAACSACGISAEGDADTLASRLAQNNEDLSLQPAGQDGLKETRTVEAPVEQRVESANEGVKFEEPSEALVHEYEEDVPASLLGLSLDVLQAACSACGLPADGDATTLASRLANAESTEETEGRFAHLGGKPRCDNVEEHSDDNVPAAQPDPSSSCSGKLESEVTKSSVAKTTLMRQPAAVQDDHVVGPPRSELTLLRKRELRQLCRGRGLDESGRKQELASRIAAHSIAEPPPTESSAGTPTPERLPRKMGIRTSLPSKALLHPELETFVSAPPEPEAYESTVETRRPAEPAQKRLRHADRKQEQSRLFEWKSTMKATIEEDTKKTSVQSGGQEDSKELLQEADVWLPGAPRSDPVSTSSRQQAFQERTSSSKAEPPSEGQITPVPSSKRSILWLAPEAHADLPGATTPPPVPQSLVAQDANVGTVSIPAQESLLKRPRVAEQAADTACRPRSSMTGMPELWQTMAVYKKQAKVATGRPPLSSPTRQSAMSSSRLVEPLAFTGNPHQRASAPRARASCSGRSKKASAVGTCHGWTGAGAPCRAAGVVRPPNSRFCYCKKHVSKWARFEPVGADQLSPKINKAASNSHQTASSDFAVSVGRACLTPPRKRRRAESPQAVQKQEVSMASNSVLPRESAALGHRVSGRATGPQSAPSFSIGSRMYGGAGVSSSAVPRSHGGAGMLSGLADVMQLLPQ